jgi:hypothetical protein
MILPVLSLVLLLLPAGILAQTGDQHLAGPAGELFLASPFAHGYIHGYEDGFHHGNIDYHEGLRARSLNEFPDYRVAKAGYLRHFGKLKPFRGGYKAGFRAGYADAIAGREFLGVAAVRVAAQKLPGDAIASIAGSGGFDRGFGDGYALGLTAGKHAGAADADFDATSHMCAPGSTDPSYSVAYCEGFTRAYTLGYRNGYLSPSAEGTRVATISGSR